jgi:hypothetical protein
MCVGRERWLVGWLVLLACCAFLPGQRKNSGIPFFYSKRIGEREREMMMKVMTNFFCPFFFSNDDENGAKGASRCGRVL